VCTRTHKRTDKHIEQRIAIERARASESVRERSMPEVMRGAEEAVAQLGPSAAPPQEV
jgi:hypothetical protein